MPSVNNERLFNPNGWRHYRRRYSLTEVHIGLIIMAGLSVLTAWVFWMGANPDPELFSVSETLLDKGSASAPLRARKLASATGTTGLSGDRLGASAADVEGPINASTPLAGPGWQQGNLTSFDNDTLYEKINGRAGYYRSFGFQRLYFLSLMHETDDQAFVDLELFDMGTAANALGAYAGERQPDAKPTMEDGAVGHIARNAMFAVRGQFYARAIGSDETELIRSQLVRMRQTLASALPGQELPWTFGLFISAVGLSPDKVGFHPENAFSFGFARNVYTGLLEGDAELFITAASDEAAAKTLAQQFIDGFSSYGRPVADDGEIPWVEDQYLSTVSGVTARGPLVVGIRGGADLASAKAALERLLQSVDALSAQDLERGAEQMRSQSATPSSPAGETEGSGDGYGGEGDGDGYGGEGGGDEYGGEGGGDEYGGEGGGDEYGGEGGGGGGEYDSDSGGEGQYRANTDQGEYGGGAQEYGGSEL